MENQSLRDEILEGKVIGFVFETSYRDGNPRARVECDTQEEARAFLATNSAATRGMIYWMRFQRKDGVIEEQLGYRADYQTGQKAYRFICNTCSAVHPIWVVSDRPPTKAEAEECSCHGF